MQIFKVFKNKKRKKDTHIFLICFPEINSYDNIAQKKKKSYDNKNSKFKLQF